MNDIRRSILWVVFGFSMVLLWDQWQVYNGRPATFFPSPTATAKAPAPSAPAGSAPASASPGSVPTATAPAATSAGSAAVPTGAETPGRAREPVVVTTDVMRLTFDTEGGSVVRTELLQHAADHTQGRKSDPRFVLLDQTSERVYLAQTGVIGGDFPNHKTLMTVAPGPRELAGGASELVVRFESPEKNGIKLVKTYTLKRGAFDIAVRHDVVNTGSAAVTPQVYLQLVRDGNKLSTESAFYSTFTGPAVYTDEKKFQKVEFTDIEKGKADFQPKSASGYVAMVQHYFASAWILPAGTPREIFMRKIDTNLYGAGLITAPQTLAPGATATVQSTLFTGPQQENMLERIAPGLDLVKDYGWLTILAKPLYWLMDKLHGYIGNWGWTIMALVLIIKIAFYWLQAKGYESMAKMKAVNPRIMQLRERLKDNPQQMQQEMMRIYREEKVNPLGGCLPILVQVPVFIALYWVLLSSVEMRYAPWIGWIQDLSAKDPYFILPVFMTLTTLLQTALNPVPPDPMQARLMWMMPLVFSVMFFFFPAGLVLYWITNNVLSIAQQWLINTRMGVPPEFNLPKFKKS
jgi:YidC/Oxa1 family membrane protein insertase